MAKIAISNLPPTGSDLFQDSESFLQELTNNEIDNVLGGFKLEITWSLLCVEF